MLNSGLFKIWVHIIFLFFIFFSVSCIDTKKATYFSDVPDNMTLADKGKIPVSLINPYDILRIEIMSPNPQASGLLNASQGSAPSSGYIVDSTGFIQMPLLGNIKAQGYTLNQLKAIITKEIINKELLLEPVVNIHYLNYKVTILGEVKSPTVITVPNEKMSILEALGLAGDLTPYAKLNTVLLVRETETGELNFKRLNLNSNEIFRSPYYYLKAGDVIYVEPNKSRIANASRAPQLLSYLLSGLSLILIIVQLTRL